MTFKEAFESEVKAIGYDGPHHQRHHYRTLLLERVRPAIERAIPENMACTVYLDSHQNEYPHEVRVRAVCVAFATHVMLMVPDTSAPLRIAVVPQSSITNIVITQSQWDDVEPTENTIVRVRLELRAKRVKREGTGVGSVQRQHFEIQSSGARCLSLLQFVRSLISPTAVNAFQGEG